MENPEAAVKASATEQHSHVVHLDKKAEATHPSAATHKQETTHKAAPKRTPAKRAAKSPKEAKKVQTASTHKVKRAAQPGEVKRPRFGGVKAQGQVTKDTFTRLKHLAKEDKIHPTTGAQVRLGTTIFAHMTIAERKTLVDKYGKFVN